MVTLLNKFNDGYVMHQDDILDISATYIKEKNLELFLNDIIFNDYLEDIAAYNPSKSIIYINMKKLWESCYKHANKLQQIHRIDNNYYPYLLNYYCLYIIFHEITHAIQKKNHDMLTCSTPNVYLFLYELCEKLERENQSFYDKNHDLFPMEIEANNNGLLKSYNLLSHTNLPKREKRILYLQYIISLLSNYEKTSNNFISTPLDKLYKEETRINIKMIYDLFHQCNLDKIERLNLGLDITPKEYNGLQKEKKRLLIKR